MEKTSLDTDKQPSGSMLARVWRSACAKRGLRTVPLDARQTAMLKHGVQAWGDGDGYEGIAILDRVFKQWRRFVTVANVDHGAWPMPAEPTVEFCATSKHLNAAFKLVDGEPDMEANHGRR